MEYLLLEDLEREKMITLGRGNIISKIDINAIPGNYPIYSSSATGNGEFGRYGKYMFEDERVTWSIDGGGRPFYREKHKYSVTNVCGWLKINTDKLITKFVYYCLLFQWNMLKFDYTYKAHPSIIKEIYRIPMLPISIQKVIVEQLDKINNQISKSTNTLLYFEELTKSRFNEMFGTIKNEHSFIECTLGDEITTLSDFSANGSYAKLDSNVKMYDEPNFAWMVRTTDLENENFTDIKYIDEKAYNLLSKSQLFGNELIMCKIGSAGKIYLMPKINMPASLGRNAFLIRFNNQNVNMTYLFAYLNTYDLQKEIQQRVKGAVTKTITKDEVRSIPLILPPKALQDKYSAFVKQVDKLKFNVQKQIKYYQELLDLKMHEYFDVEEED